MAQLKGPGSMKAVNLIAVTFPNNVTADGKSRYLDVQVDARDPRGPGQTNLHLITERSKDAAGKDRINNGAPYSTAQFQAIKEAAGGEFTTLPNGAEVYAVKADLMPSSRKSGLVLNTKTVATSDFTMDDKVLDNQFASVKTAREAKAEAAQADVAEAQAETPQVEAAEAKVDEPALG